MAFKLFDYIDQKLIEMEHHGSAPSKNGSVWPSEASAVLLDSRQNKIVGKCQRQTLFRMIGEPKTDKLDAQSARRFRMGRMCEQDITDVAKASGIFVASGIKDYIPGVDISPEIDLLLIDPVTRQGYICENKSVYGWGASEVIEKGKPKLEAIIQLSLYLNEFPTGAAIKEAIHRSVAKREEAEAKGFEHRFRCEVDYDQLALLDDGPLQAKLSYEARDSCSAAEFDLSIVEDPIDGLHFPCINGEVRTYFTIESIYERFQELKAHYWRMRNLVVAQLVARNDMPAGLDVEQENQYFDLIAEEMRNLPMNQFPPAEYEWKYSDEKINRLAAEGLIAKTKYAGWQKGHAKYAKIGDWTCDYCSYKMRCISAEYPETRHMLLDIPLDEAA